MLQIQPDYCRERAMEALKRADRAPSEELRASFFELAESWRHLAEEIEKPFRWRRAHR
ncbi:MAG TPA: hypothetical protein VHZ32_00245 [Rhizomicrobium sp.]|jgi:hypothetical protein|nr:hypothetical protein [Rhizomicrobium sp.]